MPKRYRIRLYRFELERGYLDALINLLILGPFLALFRLCDRLERRWTNFLSGGESRESDLIKPHSESLEEYL